MNSKSISDNFASGSVFKAVCRNAVPAIIGMMMVLIYNLVDTFFIAQTHNNYMLTASSLGAPVFLLFMAFGTIFGIGGTSVISRAMGEQRYDYAKQVSSFCMWACVAVGGISLIVSLCRQGFIYMPAVFLLENMIGIDGLVWAQPTADILSLIMCALLLGRTLKHLEWKVPGSKDTVLQDE